MAFFVTVAASVVRRVLRLGTLSGLVPLLTVRGQQITWLETLWNMCLPAITAIKASTTAGGTVFREMTHCKSSVGSVGRQWEILLSLHFLHSTPSAERGSVHSAAVWPGCLTSLALTLDGRPVYLLAITTGEPVLTRFGAITGTVAIRITVNAFHSHTVHAKSFFGTSANSVAELYIYVSMTGVKGCLFRLPPQRPHLEIPRSIGSPASLRRSRFSSGEDGQPWAAFARRGLGEK